MTKRIEALLKITVLALVAWAIAITALEYGSRLIMPVTLWPAYVSPEGEPVKVVESAVTFTRGLVYRQIATEFDVRTTITAQGHRVPEVHDNPETIFIGDSFTFGWGLADRDTFVYRYCAATGRSCANLGRPNTGTGRQVEILEHFLEEQAWHPRRVVLFMFAMSSILMPGNDFYDDLQDAQAPPEDKAKTPRSEPTTFYERIFALRGNLLESSNVVRIVKYALSPWLRATLYPAAHEHQLGQALAITRTHLDTLAALGRRYHFEHEIYVLHPMQDLLNGTYGETLETVRSLAPDVAVRDTAPALLDDPLKYYYHYDAHLNPAGARRVAELLVREDSRQASPCNDPAREPGRRSTNAPDAGMRAAGYIWQM